MTAAAAVCPRGFGVDSARRGAYAHRRNGETPCPVCAASEAATDRHRDRTGNRERMIYNRARTLATARLIAEHGAQFERLFHAELLAARRQADELDAAAAEEEGLRAAAEAAAAARREHNPYRQLGLPTAPPPRPTAPPKLMPGPARPGQAPTDRIVRNDVGSCRVCIVRHDRDHVCPVCNTRPTLTTAPVRNPL